MSSFAVAWDSIAKEWTPNWRSIAEDLPWLSESEQRRLISEESLDDIMGQGNSLTTLPHPNDERFVVKIPHGYFARRVEDDSRELMWRTGYPQNIPQIMEEMGFPVSSELDVQGEYLVQPRLNQHAVDTGVGRKGRHRLGIADILLNHAFGDRVGANWGQDQTGNWRFYDPDMEHTSPHDWWPNAPNIPGKDYPQQTVGEILQEDLDKWKIQLPASRMLDVLGRDRQYEYPGESDYGGLMQSFYSYLEELEPYSDNPKTVQIDGKSPWLEGY